MKTLAVLMHDDAGQEARFQAALDLTRALDGHLTCIDVSVMPVFAGDYIDPGATALLMEDERVREQGNRARMRARLEAEGVRFDWIDETGFLAPCVRDSAALVDLIVLNRELDRLRYPDMLDLVGECVVKTGKPVVAVPERAGGFDAFGTALIAWDGSPAAEAALRAAAPLLVHASRVVLLEVDDGSIKAPAEAAAEYLSRHGVRAEIRRESRPSAGAASVILDAIAAERAAYLVMGGFGHSRFLEAAFGGVTRRMLKECPVPLFLAH